MSVPLCIYHGDCQDGFGAAWAVRHALGDRVEFYPGIYQSDPPEVSGREVIIVDFSYTRPVLEQIIAAADSLLVLDHHKSAAEDLAFLPPAPPSWLAHWEGLGGIIKHARAVFDMERSGAGIAWDFFHPGERRPPQIDHIEDRDLWRFELAGTREICAALFSYPYHFAVWDRLMRPAMLPVLAIDGEAIDRHQHKEVSDLVAVSRREMVIGGIAMPVANLPHTMSSYAGHMMAAESLSRVAACYQDTPAGRVFSLRSTTLGPDVSEIAKQYGGGGHQHAAGFRRPIGWEGDRADAIA